MTDAQITKMYSKPSMMGGDLPYFVGKQYGSGWLRTLGKFAFPFLRKVANVALNTGEDVASGKNWKTSLRDNALSEVGIKRGKTINKRKKHTMANTIFTNKRRRK